MPARRRSGGAVARGGGGEARLLRVVEALAEPLAHTRLLLPREVPTLALDVAHGDAAHLAHKLAVVHLAVAIEVHSREEALRARARQRDTHVAERAMQLVEGEKAVLVGVDGVEGAVDVRRVLQQRAAHLLIRHAVGRARVAVGPRGVRVAEALEEVLVLHVALPCEMDAACPISTG